MVPKLSVIIPVYKVEDYLERCVKSVINQDFRDLEIILVDDGSPDRCPQICDELALRDCRISVIHKINGGSSSARNIGIKVAKGDYITFLDSDDQWKEGLLFGIMGNVIEANVDMFMFTSISLYPNGVLMKRDYGGLGGDDYQIYNRFELYNYFIQNGNLREQPATHIMKADFMRSNQLFYKEGIIGEDTEWMFRVLRIIDKVAVSDKPFLIYSEQRPGSITNTVSTKWVKDPLSIIQSSIDFYEANPDVDVKQYELAHCSYLWSVVLGYSSFLPDDQKTEFIPLIKQQYKCLPLDKHFKSKLVAKLYALFGYAITSKILWVYINLHNRNILNSKRKLNG